MININNIRLFIFKIFKIFINYKTEFTIYNKEFIQISKMDISYVKESLLLVEDFDCKIKNFKTRIFDETYIYEKNKNSNFEKNIREIKKDMENYLQTELMKDKEEKEEISKYLILLFIISYIIGIFLYININKLASYVMISGTTFIMLFTIYIYNEDYNSRIRVQDINKKSINHCINLLDNICNKLIYTNVKS